MVESTETCVQWTGQRLAACDQRSPSPPAIAIIILVVFFRLLLDISLNDLLHITNLNQDVFGLQICVDDAAFAVEIIKPQKDLFGNLLDQWHGNAAVIPPLDQTQ